MDSSIFIVSAYFFNSEDTEPMMSELKNAIRRHGLPLLFYSDNDSVYKSRCLKVAGAQTFLMNLRKP